MTRIQGVIFDLDQTLIDSRAAEAYRRQRMWQAVYRIVHQLRPYPGIPDVLQLLKERNITACIVTATPRQYCRRVLSQWRWNDYFTDVVAYHDTWRHKPHPDPILLSLRKMNLHPSLVVAVGDTPDDIVSARAAGVLAIGALWGASQPDLVVQAEPDVVCRTVQELRQWVETHVSSG